MLVGRQLERERIEEMLEGARAERSGTLLLRGEAGIGKTALLDHAVDRAAGMTVVRALGVESEAELEFSGLHEACLPLLDRLEEIPGHQADALRGALGLVEAEATDRFTIAAATLSLLAAAAEREPLLAIIDDAHWLDRPSRDALLFAARRLQADRVAILFAAREGEPRPFEAPGIETIHLTGLESAEAESLLQRGGSGAVTPAVARVLHQATAGNPLALREISTLLSPGQRSGAEPLGAPLPAGATIERAFAGRLEGLPEATRVGLLVVATATTSRAEPMLRAIAALGAAVLLESAEDAGLLVVSDAAIEFRHPLVRAAVYAAAAPSDVRATHRALAAALSGDANSEQRAWHLAGAAVGPDAEAADALAAAATLARRRSGYAAAAAALERAARLTPDGELRVRRLFEAADAAWLAGGGERAAALVEEVLAAAGSGGLRGHALRLRGGIEYFAGQPTTASASLLDASAALDEVDAAVSAAADSVNASVPAADPAPMLRAGERARTLAPADGSDAEFEASVALGYALCFSGRIGEGEPLVRHGVEIFHLRTAVAAPLQVGRLAWALGGLGRHGEARSHVAETIALARGAGAVASLPYLLGASAWHGTLLGRWSEAYGDATEALELAAQIGQPLATAQALALLTWQEGMRGDEDRCRERIEGAVERCREFGLRLYELLAWLGLGLLEVGLGRWESAIAPLEQAARGMEERGLYVGGLSASLELAAAYARVGRAEEAEVALAAFERSELAAVPLQAAIGARCRALLAADDAGEAAFLRALDAHAEADYPFEAARTRLAYGERLRRDGRRVDAREQLRPALSAFERLGARPWAARAHDELDASGESQRPRGDESRDDLTPRELQVALQVAEGKANKEAAAALFLSPKTIEYHLKHVYGKLGIRSRGELIRLAAVEGIG
jgi:DNA-binding CsgD family transcriptional regulator